MRALYGVAWFVEGLQVLAYAAVVNSTLSLCQLNCGCLAITAACRPPLSCQQRQRSQPAEASLVWLVPWALALLQAAAVVQPLQRPRMHAASCLAAEAARQQLAKEHWSAAAVERAFKICLRMRPGQSCLVAAAATAAMARGHQQLVLQHHNVARQLAAAAAATVAVALRQLAAAALHQQLHLASRLQARPVRLFPEPAAQAAAMQGCL